MGEGPAVVLGPRLLPGNLNGVETCERLLKVVVGDLVLVDVEPVEDRLVQ